MTPQPQKQMTYDYEAPLNYWQQQVNFYENTIQEKEERRLVIPRNLRSGLALAKASLKQWKLAAKEEMAAKGAK